MTHAETAIVILAGGDARRLPGKLERPIRGTPLLSRVYRNLRGAFPVYVSVRTAIPASLRASVDCAEIVDRYPACGPIGGLATAAQTLEVSRIFAVAGDAPAVTLDVLDALFAAWQPGDDAAVPEHDERVEPLAALYDRHALLRETASAIAEGRYALRELLERLRIRRVPLAGDFFVNVNTEADLARIGER